jgi:hypothetical protein
MEQVVKLIDFEGGQILGVKDENGKVWMGIRNTCRDIGLSEGQCDRQVANIENNIVLKPNSCKFAMVQNEGNRQVNREVLCISEDFVPFWLGQITLTPKMKEENPKAVDKLVNYQLKAAKVLHEAFMGTEEKKQQFFDELGIQGIIVNAVKEAITPIQQELYIVKNELHTANNELSEMKNNIHFKQNVNPRYMMEHLITDYLTASISHICNT